MYNVVLLLGIEFGQRYSPSIKYDKNIWHQDRLLLCMNMNTRHYFSLWMSTVRHLIIVMCTICVDRILILVPFHPVRPFFSAFQMVHSVFYH